jgi:linoleoyl-CoA desaturase
MASPALQTNDSEFPTVLRQRMNGYFRVAGIPKTGTSLMTGKIVGGLAAAVITYSSLYWIPMNGGEFLLIYVLFGLTQLYLMLNIAHDSNHYSITGNRPVGKLLSRILDAVGINSYIWRLLHNVGHHSHINVVGDDEDVLARGFLRFTPEVRRRWFHRGQHFYCWIIYALSIFDWVLMKDYIYFFFSSYKLTSRVKHPVSEYVGLFFWKSFYYAYMLVLPVMILKRSPWLVAAAFVCAQAAIGLFAQFVFQTTHVIGSSYFPKGKSEYDNYTYHVLATTADYSTEGRLPFLFLGGLNYHVAHHLCPSVCHVHYPALTKIIRETAAEFEVPYRSHRTIWQALAQHYRHLRQLAVKD